MISLRIDAERLQQQIDDLAAISEAPPPVVTRVLFSEADLKGRAFVKQLCQELGLSIREDAVGNIFARWAGSESDLPAIATGSHIDAIPNAGRYDGVVGVLGGIEAFRAIKEAGIVPRRSLELIVFTAEEPTRFGIGCLGSRMLAGAMEPARVSALRDRDGHGLEHWVRRAGLEAGSRMATEAERVQAVRLSRNFYAAFVELHIEQGPILEQENIPIGIVEKIAAPSTLRLQLTGVGGHAGAVLMSDRHDALLAGSEIALAVEHAVLNTESADTVGTTGVFRIEPGAVNSVPYGAWLEIDVRDTVLASRDKALEQIEEQTAAICKRRGIKFQSERLNVDPPAVCDATIVQTAASVCSELQVRSKRMISRAYHDSLFMAQVCPTAMIFIPCRGGVSHRPDEFSSPEQIRAGVQVLAHTLCRLAC